MTRAVVTGVGCITPIGQSVGEFWDSLTAGRSGVRRITLFDPSDQDCQIAAEVKEPKAVRFAWHETAQPNLCNAAGLPAEPFRTDALVK